MVYMYIVQIQKIPFYIYPFTEEIGISWGWGVYKEMSEA